MLLSLNGTFAAPGPFATNPHATPLMTDLSSDGADDVMVINEAGDILWRKGRPQEPGTFDPPITINNPDHPSRDIVAVDTPQGPVLASVDATDNAISLYAWGGGTVVWIGSLPTGSLPTQIVAADLNGDGGDDLVVRNAGDGTLTVFFTNGSGSDPTGNALFPSSVPLPVGLGVSDVTLADVDQDGVPDIVVTNKVSGEVGVRHNLGHGIFAPAVLYRAGGGLYGVTTNTSGAATLTTLEATAGVAAGAFTPGGPPDLVATDPGSNTFSLLKGLGAGRFANPVTVPTASPARAIRVADLGNGVPDAIVLGTNTVSIYRGDGQGGFLPPRPDDIYDAGPDPTGLTVADVNHDGKLDLLVGNPFGDVLVLLGNGDGTFQPYRKADQSVALAVADLGNGTKDFIYANQGLDRVVVDYGGQKTVVGDRSTGLLAPGAVKLADLNGDGIPDLIVANSGSNNVLIYPGAGQRPVRPGAQWRPRLLRRHQPGRHHRGRRQRRRPARPGGCQQGLQRRLDPAQPVSRQPHHLHARAPPQGRWFRAGGHGRQGRDRRRQARRPGQQQPVEQCHAAAGRRQRLLQRPESQGLLRGQRPRPRVRTASSTAGPAC